MRVGDGAGHGGHDANKAKPLASAVGFLDRRVQRFAIYKTHRVVRRLVFERTRCVDRHDRRMLQACGDLDLAFEATLQRWIVGTRQLERDASLELLVERLDDEPHATRGDRAAENQASDGAWSAALR